MMCYYNYDLDHNINCCRNNRPSFTSKIFVRNNITKPRCYFRHLFLKFRLIFCEVIKGCCINNIMTNYSFYKKHSSNDSKEIQ